MQEIIDKYDTAHSSYLLPIIKPSNNIDERKQYIYAAHNIKIAQIGSAANKVANIIGPTFKLIKQTCSEAEGMAAYIGIAADVIGFCNLLFSNITKNLGSTMEATVIWTTGLFPPFPCWLCWATRCAWSSPARLPMLWH